MASPTTLRPLIFASSGPKHAFRAFFSNISGHIQSRSRSPAKLFESELRHASSRSRTAAATTRPCLCNGVSIRFTRHYSTPPTYSPSTASSTPTTLSAEPIPMPPPAEEPSLSPTASSSTSAAESSSQSLGGDDPVSYSSPGSEPSSSSDTSFSHSTSPPSSSEPSSFSSSSTATTEPPTESFEPSEPSSSSIPPPPPPKPSLPARFSTFMDNLQTRFLAGTQTLNELTGYDSIERIKHTNARLETELSAAQSRLRASRALYKTTHSARASTQREVTTLLARKDAWSPSDLERFTTLYRQDHILESEAVQAARDLQEAEDEEARLGAALNSGMLRRYHEEQIWSDRIRRASTWGTWGLMGFNVVLFVVVQLVAEPWRRRRLVRSIAERERSAMEEVRAELEAVKGALAVAAAATATSATTDVEETAAATAARREVGAEAGGLATASTVAAATAAALPLPPPPPSPLPPPPSWTELLADPKLWGPAVSDLYSERVVSLRMRDASVIALEGTLTGAVLMAGAAAFFFRR